MQVSAVFNEFCDLFSVKLRSICQIACIFFTNIRADFRYKN